MKSFNVLHVLNEIQPSGAEMMLLAALQRFREAGADVALLATGAKKGVIASRFEEKTVKVLHLPFSFTPRYFFRVWRLFRETTWDVIHLHSERATFYYALAALAARKPVVRTVHNVFRFDGHLKWRRRLQRQILERLGVRHVAIGASVLQNERSRFGIHPVLVSNWFDDNRFRVATAAVREEARLLFGLSAKARFVIASVGNCSETKNHQSLINALALLQPADRPLYLHAGIEDPLESERKLVEKLGLRSDVHFLGPVGNVPALLSAADAFVMPSLFEGMSIAAIEAVGSGLLCVLSDVPGLCDLKEEFPQIIYCGTDAASIADALVRATRVSDDQRARIAELQTSKARSMFGIEQGVQGYLRVYDEVCRPSL